MDKKWREDQEYIDLIADLLETDEVQRLESFVHHKVTNRLAHSISVSYRSYLWAKRLNLDTRAVARAGLLHDLFFYEGVDKHLVGGKGHNWEHPRIALENALKLTELSDLEQDIIVKHMFGATIALPKYKESFIVSLMDKQSAISELWVGAANLTYRMYGRYLRKVTTFLL
ncbi:HD domain-containing protein [Tuanshanicoccus lijuaniae]|uniref:HD domain-containing protein n=1 Tax=Aerococcaceae bacterium zg-1292 TaxID=2774330 RepID=UPI0019358767|nr:HD domain-containing protein [Aerococcaceae bacterium zg-1292]MBF6626098.1 HD domain-containing protein [Aerococcaceae bacterium zg-BR9]MBF6978814.1 HD domain-containing protein [Aerococcaceae bacterium zg-BR22]MBS4455248.1 HD domain-containing protein [Aerococcaceae bacterium zg-A91]MBS4457942.1 HD domain-containing protein [Aerococcaceae bacterium zg-BR33]